MKSKKIVAAGHVCLDVTPVFAEGCDGPGIVQRLRPGKMVQVENADVAPGGSVSITGLALKKLGNAVTLLGKVGDDPNGEMLRRLYAAEGADGLIVDPESATSYSVVLAVPGLDRMYLHHPGANDTFCDADIPDAVLRDAALFHFGYPPLMRRVYEDGGAETVKILKRVRAMGIATSLDMSTVDPASAAGHADWVTFCENVLPYVDFFVPSFEELLFMLDRPKYDRFTMLGGSMSDLLEIGRDVMPLGEKALSMGCGAVLIKCGMAGMVLQSSDMARVGARLELDKALWANRELHQCAFRPERVRSSNGAGDAAIAAFLTGLVNGDGPERCAVLAAAEGASAVTTYDSLSGVLPIDELVRRIDDGWEKIE